MSTSRPPLRRLCFAMCFRLALSILVFSGCVRRLPPPRTPAQVLPRGDLSAPPPGPEASRVVLDTVDAPALVEEQTGRMEGVDTEGNAVSGFTFRTVCPSTPCAANLTQGLHWLRFTALKDPSLFGTWDVTVPGEPTAYRYAMGRHDTGTWLAGLLTIGIGVATGLSGGILYGAGSETDPFTHQSQNPGLQATGVGLMIGSGVLLSLSIVLFTVFRPETQDGAGVQWPLPDSNSPGLEGSGGISTKSWNASALPTP